MPRIFAGLTYRGDGDGLSLWATPRGCWSTKSASLEDESFEIECSKMRKSIWRRLNPVFLFGVAVYLAFLIYNAFWQPVLVVVPNDFRGVVRVQYQPNWLSGLLGYKKTIFVDDREIIVLRSRMPYEHFCGTVGMYQDGREIEKGDGQKPSADEKVRLYLAGFVNDEPEEVWFVVGDAADLMSAHRERWNAKLKREIPK